MSSKYPIDEDGLYNIETVEVVGNDTYKFVRKWDDYNCYERYEKNGVLHNENGCALFESLSDGNDVYCEWRYEGKLHNENGYALMSKDFIDNRFQFRYFLNGVEYNKEEYDDKIKQMKMK